MAPRKQTSSDTDSRSTITTAMFGFSDMGVSRNMSVMLSDQPLKKAYCSAEAYGELPNNRARVLILGEPRAGKTSLLNRLLGRQFDIHEQPTHGIETRMCHVTNVDKQWNESGSAKADDIRECASAVAVLGEVSLNGIKKGGVKNTLNKSPSESSDSSGDATDIMKIATQLVIALKMMLVVAIWLTVGMFQYGYVAFVWCAVGSLALFGDYNNAYRFGTVLSLVCAQLEAMIRIDQPLDNLGCRAINSSNNYLAFQSSNNILLNLIHTAIIGVSSGLGFRTGIAVAFSACQHPWETRDTAFQGVTSLTNMVTLCLNFIAGGFISLGCYKYCTVNNRWHKKKNWSLLRLNGNYVCILFGNWLQLPNSLFFLPEWVCHDIWSYMGSNLWP